MDATLFAFIVVYGIALLIGCLVGIVFYVFYSIGLYTLGFTFPFILTAFFAERLTNFFASKL